MTLIFLFRVTSVSRTQRFAESEGFEPPIRRNAYTAFRVRLFRPLRQLSSSVTAKCNQIRNFREPYLFLFLKAGAKVLLFFDIRK